VHPFEDGRVALVLLTDDDLLQRYRREHGFVGPTIRFENAPQLTLYLNSIPQNITHITIDPSTESTFTASIADLTQKLRSQ
jgi:hypothetical protein